MTTTNEVKPYTDEDVENLRRSVNDARNNPPTPRVVRRLLATIDERTKERNKAKDVAERLRSRVMELEETLARAETSWDEEVKELTTEAAALRERLLAVEQERDAEARAASSHAAEAERMLRSACDMRDALDSVASHLGVDTNTDADAEAKACVSAVAALREEVERLRGVLAIEEEVARALAEERRG